MTNTTPPEFYAKYLRETTSDALAGVRSGVASVLVGGSPALLKDELRSIYFTRDDALIRRVDGLLWGWLKVDDPTRNLCGDILQAALSEQWDEEAVRHIY